MFYILCTSQYLLNWKRNDSKFISMKIAQFNSSSNTVNSNTIMINRKNISIFKPKQ